MSKPLIVIPARMGSTRFPGKPMAKIAGISMLRRTANVAARVEGTDFVVATDSKDILEHCQMYSLPAILTSANIQSGSDRALAAVEALDSMAEIVVNLQGDAPFTDPAHVSAVIDKLRHDSVDMATPYVQLDWYALSELRQVKEYTPFSGTTLVHKDGLAVWFSKTIIPAIRNFDALRAKSDLSPVCRHIGLYAFRRDALEKYTKLPMGYYETFEGLEQLRALENNMTIAVVKVNVPTISSPGIDTPQDLARAEALIAEHGDPFRAK